MASHRDRLVVWIAQGLGSGRARVAPGTVGSLLGLPWFLVLLASGDPMLFALGTVLGVGLAVPVCGRAEAVLRQKDPGSVVLDEIVAVPIACAGWAWSAAQDLGRWVVPSDCLSGAALGWLAAAFVGFRLLDALKPPPIHACQRLPGGWGIVVDDVMAGGLTAVALVVAARCWR